MHVHIHVNAPMHTYVLTIHQYKNKSMPQTHKYIQTHTQHAHTRVNTHTPNQATDTQKAYNSQNPVLY